MRDGTCDKCGGSVRQLTVGIYDSRREGVMVNDASGILSPSSYETFVCTSCGYWENYLTDVVKLSQIEEGQGGWAPPAG